MGQCASPKVNAAAKAGVILDGCKLHYFPIFMARGGAVRLTLLIAGVDFQEVKVTDWATTKPKTVFGGLPILELRDGTKIAQLRSILRFIGRVKGLYPADLTAAAAVDQAMDAMEDINLAIQKEGRGKEKAEMQEARRKSIMEGSVKESLRQLNTFIGKTGDGKHCAGSQLTVADVFVACTSTGLVDGFIEGPPPNALDGFQNIQGVRKTVACHPAVVKFMDAAGDASASAWKAARNL